MSNDIVNIRRVFFYHHQRIIWPLLGGITTFLLAKNVTFTVFSFSNCAVPAFISYVSFGIFYDWFLFTCLARKDSEKLTPEEWKQNKITASQIDKCNEFFVMVRRCAFAIAVFFTSTSALFFPQTSLMEIFFFSYVGITIVLISIGIITKEIIFKYALRHISCGCRNKDHIDPIDMYPLDGPMIDPRGRIINTRYH